MKLGKRNAPGKGPRWFLLDHREYPEASLEILGDDRIGERQGETTYRVKHTCCNTVAVRSHTYLEEKIRKKRIHCANCSQAYTAKRRAQCRAEKMQEKRAEKVAKVAARRKPAVHRLKAVDLWTLAMRQRTA